MEPIFYYVLQSYKQDAPPEQKASLLEVDKTTINSLFKKIKRVFIKKMRPEGAS